MNGVTHYTQWQWPELMWRVDAELSLVEVTNDPASGGWLLSHMDLIHVEALLERKDMTEVPAP